MDPQSCNEPLCLNPCQERDFPRPERGRPQGQETPANLKKASSRGVSHRLRPPCSALRAPGPGGCPEMQGSLWNPSGHFSPESPLLALRQNPANFTTFPNPLPLNR